MAGPPQLGGGPGILGPAEALIPASTQGPAVTPTMGILYEHPEWFRPLFAELERRGIGFERIDAASHVFEPGSRSERYGLVVNRMSPSAWLRGHAGAVFHTLDYLTHLEDVGVPVVNGRAAYQHEISKVRQLSLLARLGIRHPPARAINHPSQAMAGADGFTYPVLVKPNIGGSGGGITSFPDADALAAAVASGMLDDLGPDHTALIQEHLPARGESIVRVEVLDGEFLYAIKVRLFPGSFNLCPADYCELPGIGEGAADPIEGFTPPPEVVADAIRIIGAAGIDVGGVEYLVNDRDGEPNFYDINALSNFVADAPAVVGFDPFVNLVDYLERRLAEAAPVG